MAKQRLLTIFLYTEAFRPCTWQKGLLLSFPNGIPSLWLFAAQQAPHSPGHSPKEQGKQSLSAQTTHRWVIVCINLMSQAEKEGSPSFNLGKSLQPPL